MENFRIEKDKIYDYIKEAKNTLQMLEYIIILMFVRIREK